MQPYVLLEASAKLACSLLRGKPDNWTAIAAQFALEKGWAWWADPQPPYDVGNVMTTQGAGHPVGFPTLEAGVQGYADFLTIFDRTGLYTKVVWAVRRGTPLACLSALSLSPYCAPPYTLDTLLAVWDLVLQRFPDPAKPKPWIVEVGYFDSQAQAQEGQARILELAGYHALGVRQA